MTDLTKNSTRTQAERGTVHPILFQPAMVRALLAGTKTQTRRVLKPQPFADGYYEGEVDCTFVPAPASNLHAYARFGAAAVGGDGIRTETFTPRIQPGDTLWLRESVQAVVDAEEFDAIRYLADGHVERSRAETAAEADRYFEQLYGYRRRKGAPDRMTGVPVPSIHMPRWASRLTLIVTDVRVERLQDISEEDARAEGAPDMARAIGADSVYEPTGETHREISDRLNWCKRWYALLWDEINGPGAWKANPWVVAYSFRVEHRNIDATGAP